MENIQNDGTLQHHGILGQRWGVRRTEEQLRRASGTVNSSNPTKDMTDAELRQKLNRMQMEKQYKDLTSKEISTGQAAAQKVLKIATTVATVTTTGLTIYRNAGTIQKIIKEKLG